MNLDEIVVKADELLQDVNMVAYEYNIYHPVTRELIGTLYTPVDFGKELNGLLIRSDDGEA